MGRHPIKVQWPSSSAFAQAGWKDSYRTLHPDEVQFPGFTWSPLSKPGDDKDHLDRLDFVMFQGQGIQAQKSLIVGESSDTSDLVINNYPTDHRGVMTEFKVSK